MTYRDRIMACWRGKAVGGTLGQTFEGLTGPLEATFYHPVPTSMVPNDDLDLQVLFAVVLAGLVRPEVDRHVLADAWQRHVGFPWNEYGVALRNLAEGIEPPFSGSFDNWFACGEGAAIRSELWACLAPGDPDLAAAYAYEDACVDHAGDGIVAAQFLARLQALAFVETDPGRLLDGAVAGLDPDSGVVRVVADTRGWVAEGLDWTQVRTRILRRYANSDFTDVRINTGFVVLGWLAGRDFSERLLICTNCGADTDSTAATLGALLGILNPTAIDERWLAPIGDDLVLNAEIRGIQAPPTLAAFADLVEELRQRLAGAAPRAESGAFDPSVHAIPVEVAWMSTASDPWRVRDMNELPHVGSPAPTARLDFAPATLPGTWTRLDRAEFADRILVLRFRMDGRGRDRVRLMFACTEHFRVWLDGDYLFGGAGTDAMFPAPHAAPHGQFHDFTLSAGPHDLIVAVRRPPAERATAEWVIGLVGMPGAQWIENAFRDPAAPRAAAPLAAPIAKGRVEDRTLAGPAGPLPVRVYTPPRPVAGVVWLHGGAFRSGGLDTAESDDVARRLAAQGITVVAVDYRLAPGDDRVPAERRGFRYPVALDETAFVFEWARKTMASVPWSIGGASAGANLATGATLRSRLSPRLVLLAYPTLQAVQDRYLALAGASDGFPEGLMAMYENYFGGPIAEAPVWVVPGEATPADLRGFPRTVIVNADADPFRPSGERFASTLLRAGVQIDLLRPPGTRHGFLSRPYEDGGAQTIELFARRVLEDAAGRSPRPTSAADLRGASPERGGSAGHRRNATVPDHGESAGREGSRTRRPTHAAGSEEEGTCSSIPNVRRVSLSPTDASSSHWICRPSDAEINSAAR